MRHCRGCGAHNNPPLVCACLGRACPTCAQRAGRECVAPATGRTAARPHNARLRLAHPEWWPQPTQETR